MAVSAYASLVSLTHFLDNLHYRAQFHFPRADIKQIELLQGNVYSLLEFVEQQSETKGPEIEGLWKEIVEVAFEAEDMINFHVVTQLHTISQGGISEPNFSAFCEEMETLISKFCSIKEKLTSFIKEVGDDAQVQKQPRTFVPIGGSSAAASSSVKKVTIGIDEHVVRIMDKLTRGESNLQVFPITGMGGIGKTTLARSVFNHPYIVESFDLHIWLTISQEYSVEQILMALLDEKNRGTCQNLVKVGERLYKHLFGRKYFIVLDDVWTIKAWEDLRKFFPNNGNGSCIMVTTRQSDVAVSLGSHNPYPLSFLDEDKSWELFCQNTFGHIGCPHPGLEKIGKKIMRSCRGLPLEIVVIGHMLANSSMTRQYWEFVEENISSLGNLEDDKHCLKVLSLSYESLPIHLKPCFLFMRTFPEDARIKMSDLTHKWIAEGFIKQLSVKNLEEIADGFLKDLIDRNLIFRRSAKECGIHDLLRDLCFRESNNQHFIQPPRVKLDWGNISPSPSEVNATLKECIPTRPRTVKVMENIDLPIVVRYSVINIDFCGNKSFLPSTLHLLWNLQFLTIECFRLGLIVFPHEIWNMPQLRHVRVLRGINFTNPVATDIVGENFIVLKSLQSLSRVLNFKFTKDVLDRIPNLKNLKVGYTLGLEWPMFFVCDLAQLQKLESLSVQAGSLKKITFPNSLKKLSLYFYRMAWEDISILGSLPSLESLKLYGGTEGAQWNPVAGEFLRLKRLCIMNTYLVCWRADQIHFPILEWLKLDSLYNLEEIPSGIGDIPTLQSMELFECSESAMNSGKQIWEEQQSLGNESLQVHITCSGVYYQVDSLNARMTRAAIASRALLIRILVKLQKAAQLNHLYHRNTEQTKTIEEYIHFLQDFVEVGCQSKIQELETLSIKINGAVVTWDMEGLLRRLAFIIKELSVGEEEEQEDIQAGNQNLCIDAADKDTIPYEMKSVKLDDDDSHS